MSSQRQDEEAIVKAGKLKVDHRDRIKSQPRWTTETQNKESTKVRVLPFHKNFSPKKTGRSFRVINIGSVLFVSVME